MNNKVLVGMSGGVDSSVTSALLMDMEYDVSGVTLRLSDGEDYENGNAKSCCSLTEVESARSVCDGLKIRHYVFNFKERFKECVIDKFIESYLSGLTPNPCIDCNRFIKFSEMLKRAELLDIDRIATGHYAVIEKTGERFLLKKAVDVTKDQTYVLYTLTQSQLERTLMPLGAYTKKQVREIAAERGFRNANKPDSQDICFVPDGDYASFIERKTGKKYPCGVYSDENGNVIGHHYGAIRYTIGQRKGLGMGFGKPMYVIKKDMESNCVILGDEPSLFKKRVLINDMNYIPFDNPKTDIKCAGKLRYSQKEAECTLIPLEGNTAVAEFSQPQRAVTAGQAAVFYDGDIVIGGGTITE